MSKNDPPPFLGSKVMNHLAEVVGSKPRRPVYRGKYHIPPLLGPFWVYSRTLPQGVELLVEPLVKSFFCPINASPKEFLVRTPPDPPLETHFLKLLREVGGWRGGFKK